VAKQSEYCRLEGANFLSGGGEAYIVQNMRVEFAAGLAPFIFDQGLE